MAGRESVFSKPEIVQVAQQFVSAADEVWRLQRGRNSECQFFQRAVNKGQLITDNGTRQGIYVFAASGELLTRLNSLNAERVLDKLNEGLAAWEALPKADRAGPPEADYLGEERWEGSRPTDGLLLTRVARDLPPSGEPDGARAKRWNRDSVWFSAAEVAELIHTLDATDEWRALPRPFARRLACFALVDNVYGQCIPFDLEDASTLELEARCTSRGPDKLELEFRGHTLLVEDGNWTLGENLWKPKTMHPHAMETTSLGSGSFDLQSGQFTDFQWLALGRRSGYTELNSRRSRPEPGAIGFSFSLEPRSWPPAPTFLALYESDWVQSPVLGRELRKQ